MGRPSVTRRSRVRAGRLKAIVPALLAVSVAVGAAEAAEPSDLAARVERAAADAARAHVAPPDRLEVVSVRFSGSDPIGESSVEIEAPSIEGPNAAGILRVRVRLVEEKLPRGEARATVRGRVVGPAVCATRTLSRGQVIQPDDVEVRDVDLTRLTDEPVRDPAEITGRVPIRTLSADRVLTTSLVGPAPVFRRGDPIALRIAGDAMTIDVRGLALRDGVPGDVVPAENSLTGVRVEGTVQQDGTLLVVRGVRGVGGLSSQKRRSSR
ncbi:MAG: flagellar basal body P-ring formation protein FlgA [bacterium]|nr:flagellar basal body P-ring formation protein FlgA [bacterium]